MHVYRAARTGLLGLTVLFLGGCPLPTDGPPVSSILSEVFAHIDAEMITYYDVAPPVIPETAVDLNDPEYEAARLGDMQLAFSNVQQFLASPAGDCAIPALPAEARGAGRAVQPPRAMPTPTCYDTGPGTSLCIYQWPEGGGVYTLVETHYPEFWSVMVYFKGEYGGVTYPGDMDKSNDWGYLLQDHLFTKDAKTGVVQRMIEPGLCDECDFRPWVVNSFEVEDEGTICTPWGDADLIRYTYSTTMWICSPGMPDPLDRYHEVLGSVLIREPNGDVKIEHYEYDTANRKFYRSAEWFIDHEDKSISWTFYDSDGKVTGYGEIP